MRQKFKRNFRSSQQTVQCIIKVRFTYCCIILGACCPFRNEVCRFVPLKKRRGAWLFMKSTRLHFRLQPQNLPHNSIMSKDASRSSGYKAYTERICIGSFPICFEICLVLLLTSFHHCNSRYTHCILPSHMLESRSPAALWAECNTIIQDISETGQQQCSCNPSYYSLSHISGAEPTRAIYPALYGDFRRQMCVTYGWNLPPILTPIFSHVYHYCAHAQDTRSAFPPSCCLATLLLCS